jgi:hypothetical protein
MTAFFCYHQGMTWWKKILVLAAVAAPFALLEASANFVDPDAYFHAKMADLILHGGLVRDFPWLPLTTLAHNFADQHLLYHLLLVPFAAAFGPLIGVKVAAAVFATLAILALAWCLRQWGGRYAPYLAALVFTSGTLMFRLALPKAGPLAVATVLVFATMLRGRRLWPPAALAAAFVWLHGSWPLALALVAVKLLVSFAFAGRPSKWRRDEAVRVSGRQALAVGIGCLAGLVINPYFPGNLLFYWEQIVQVAVVGYGAAVNVGVEWNSYPLKSLLAENGGLWLVMNTTLVLGLYAKVAGAWRGTTREETRQVAWLTVAVGLLLLMTLRQQRHLEFMMPMMILLLGALWGWFGRAIDWRMLKSDVKAVLPASGLLATAISAYLGLVFCYLAVAATMGAVRLNHEPRHDWSAAAGLGEWLANNVEPGAMVFHDDWSDFPKIFYFAPQVRGIAGLDPVFFYRQDAAAFNRWRAVAQGEVANPAQAILADSGARYLVVRTANQALTRRLADEGLTDLAYADAYFQVYRRRD